MTPETHFMFVLFAFGGLFFMDGFADQSSFKMIFGAFLIVSGVVLV